MEGLNGEPPTAETFIDFQPYFRKVERLLKRKHDLEEEVASAVRQRNKMKEELNKKQKVLNATAKKWQMTLLEQSFRTWAKTVVARMQQGKVLLQYFLNKDKARLKLVLTEWRLQTHSTRRRRAKEDLDEATDRVNEAEAERETLEQERDAANAKLQSLKEELEIAQKELAGLDDEAVRVQREIAESKEADLTAAARAWADLCDTACVHQMKALRKKLDVLDELEEVKICVGYELNGKKIDYLPAASEEQFNVKPIYKSFPGWKTKTRGIRSFKDLPDNAKKYIHALEDFVEAKISSISTSPERDDTILVEDPFQN